MPVGPVQVSADLSIPITDLEFRYSTPGGPGGQHANRNRTRVEVVFDIESSDALSGEQRELLVRRLGPQVSVVAGEERSQARNRTVALDRLAERLRQGLHRPRPRTATKPTRGSQQRRLAAKTQRSEIKRNRIRPNPRDTGQ